MHSLGIEPWPQCCEQECTINGMTWSLSIFLLKYIESYLSCFVEAEWWLHCITLRESITDFMFQPQLYDEYSMFDGIFSIHHNVFVLSQLIGSRSTAVLAVLLSSSSSPKGAEISLWLNRFMSVSCKTVFRVLVMVDLTNTTNRLTAVKHTRCWSEAGYQVVLFRWELIGVCVLSRSADISVPAVHSGTDTFCWHTVKTSHQTTNVSSSSFFSSVWYVFSSCLMFCSQMLNCRPVSERRLRENSEYVKPEMTETLGFMY